MAQMLRTILNRLPLLVLIAACGHQEPNLAVAPVPDASQRLSFAPPADSAARAAMLTATVCLLRGGHAEDCQEAQGPQTPCDARPASQFVTLYEPLVDSVSRVRLTQAFAMNDALKRLFPDGTPMREIADARRSAPCSDWNAADGKCAALRYRDLWTLFRGPYSGQDVSTIEVFLATPACRSELP
jgi:hypothetical protein